MNAREKKFVAAYDGVMSGADACLLAGYRGTPKSRRTESSRLLAKADVRAAIDAKLKKQVEKLEDGSQKVLAELANLGFSDITEIFNDDGTLKHPSKMRPEVRRCIKSIEFEELWDGPPGEKFELGRIVKVSFWDKPKSLELLGKNKKLFTDKIEHSIEEKTLEQLIAGSMGEGGDGDR